ncbi:MAG: hypothetical protein WC352_07640, partial [Candidatus Omnitrophota bacterium]
NLDAESAESVISLLTDLNEKESQAFVMVTHDEALAWRYPNVFRLVDGVLLKEDTQKMPSEKMSS